MIRKISFLLFVLLGCSAMADDVALRPSAKFSVPLTVNGKSTVGMATVRFDGVMEVFYVLNGEIATVDYTVTKGSAPNPTPNPQPNPTPTPSKVAYIYLIHESADSSSPQAKVRSAKAWKDEADRLGIKWIPFDKDEGMKKFPVATKKAIARGLPAIVALDKDGASTVEPQPDTPEAMLAAVKRLAGGGQ